ncbi:MAG: adenylate/guanylate cyclase domain-containing protein, partial [Acidimicrobiales bacterium]
MERIWQRAWDRCGPKYLWAIRAISFMVVLPPYLLASFLVVAVARSGHYAEAAIATVVASLSISYYAFLPSGFGVVKQWAAGRKVDQTKALEATYSYTRRAFVRGFAGNIVGSTALLVVVGAVVGASGSRLVQWGVVGASLGMCVSLVGGRSFGEGALRPPRAALVSDTGIGDSLPRSRPT